MEIIRTFRISHAGDIRTSIRLNLQFRIKYVHDSTIGSIRIVKFYFLNLSDINKHFFLFLLHIFENNTKTCSSIQNITK